MRFLPVPTAAAMVLSMAGAPAVGAQEPAAASPALTVELNGLQPLEAGCRLTFVVENGLGGELRQAAFEIVLFDRDGLVSRMTIIDFRDLPAGKTKVRQFDFNGLDCATIGRLLVNDATECAGEAIAPDACIRNLETRSRADATFGS